MNDERDEVRARLTDLKAAADRLDALLSGPGRLPAIAAARAAVAVDEAVRKLGKHVKVLATSAPDHGTIVP